MSATQENHDDMLFQILKDCKTLPNFLDQVFGFLQRRTDFYQIAADSSAAVGLPEGLAEKLVKHTFFKWKPSKDDILYKESVIPVVAEETVVNEEKVGIKKKVKNKEKVKIKEKVEIKQKVEIKEKSENKDITFSGSESYNGAVYEKYCWAQTISDVDIIIKIPENINKKDLRVVICSDKISVKLKEVFLLKGELHKKIKASDAVWSLDKCKLDIHLDKCQEMWWNCLVTNEPTLDVSKIDCTRPYEELPPEAQAKIEELQWNQERKRLGLPTSEELAMQATLKKAWNAEGSPFSGPFDPSAVNIG